MENRRPRSRKKKKPGVKAWAAGIVIAIFVVAAAFTVFYIVMGMQFHTVFFPNTTINGVDASKKTVDEVKKRIASGIDGYTLTIRERDGKEEAIRGTDIALESVFDGSMEKLLEGQEPGDWLKHWQKPQSIEIGTLIQFDKAKLKAVVNGLACMDQAQVVKPRPASISGYVSGKGYSVVPAVAGTVLDGDKVEAAIEDALTQLKPELSLEDISAYEEPDVPTDDPELTARVETLNKYVNTKVTYTFGDSREIVSGDTIKDWLGIGEDGSVYISGGAVTQYVKRLASKYDTYNKAKTLNTSYGQTVRITGGSYGWRIDQKAEADKLLSIIRSGESQTREPVYKQKAASHGTNDYGNTYVEINLTAQHLYYYKEGALVVDSDFVSGNVAKGFSTPAGVYSLTYKQRNATLKGENYSTPVDYWMPFNGNIGLHDATWRSSFGGSLFKTGGSHGCVNLPHSVASKIFANIASGTPVLCYNLSGTESKKTTTSAGKPQPTTAPKPTETAENPSTQTSPQDASPTLDSEETTKAPTTADVNESVTPPSRGPGPQPADESESKPLNVPQPQPPVTTAPAGPEQGGEKGPGIPSKDSGDKEIGPGV